MQLTAAIMRNRLKGDSPLGPAIPECESVESAPFVSYRSTHAVQSQTDVAVWGTASDGGPNQISAGISQFCTKRGKKK